MGLDAVVELVIDRPDGEIAFQLLEGLLDLGELDVKAPQAGRVIVLQVGAQQVAAFAAPGSSSTRMPKAARPSPARVGVPALAKTTDTRAKRIARPIMAPTTDLETQWHRLLDMRQGADPFQNLSRYRLVDFQERDRLGAALGPAQVEGGNVDPGVA